MRASKSIIISAFTIVLLSACSSTRVYVTENSRETGFDMNDQALKSATVTSFEPVVVKEFVKPFGNKFPRTSDFTIEYTNKFTDKLKSMKLFATVAYDPSARWKLTRVSSAASDSKVLDSLLSFCKTDYLITITDFQISRRESIKYGLASPTGTSSTTTKEYCVVETLLTVFDVTARKKVLEFKSRGEQNVYMFGIENSFLKAVDSSVGHAMEYLKTGKKDFK